MLLGRRHRPAQAARRAPARGDPVRVDRVQPRWTRSAAVTSLAADGCGLGHRKGRLATGYDADLLVVAGDPLRRLDALFDVRAVFRGGIAVPLDG